MHAGGTWLGVNEDILEHFGMSKQNKLTVVPYNPNKDRIKPKDFRDLVESLILSSYLFCYCNKYCLSPRITWASKSSQI